MRTVNKYILFFLFAGNFITAAAQVPYLERTVTLHVADKPLSEVFKSITDQASVVFSYTQFDDRQKVTLNCYRKPLRIVLDELLKTSNCSYKTKDKYIIIKCDATVAKVRESLSELSGYIYNGSDSTVIQNASIYLKENKHSTLSNEFGYFIVSFPEALPPISISIAKKDYYDSTLIIYERNQSKMVVYLHPRPEYQPIKKDTSVAKPVIQVVAPKDTAVISKKDSVIEVKPDYLAKLRGNFKTFNANFKNITDTLFTGFSLSLIPSVSTNKFLSANTVNKYSFNIISGYSKGVEALEVGGIMNIDDGDVKYFQAAGVGNIVSGTFTGFQAAGIFNINHQSTDGFQAAGIYNYGGKVNGHQAAGIYNLSKGKHVGSQISGLVNKADTLTGAQIGGVVNRAKYVNGLQMSGFINSAKTVKGVQLSILNFADSCPGIPIGIFSFVNKGGYHKFELATDELLFGTLSFRTGVEKFHNIFILGMDLKHADLWTCGYGIGSGYKVAKRWNVIFDLTAQEILSRNLPEVNLNMLDRLYAGIEFKLLPKLRIGLGPCFNVMITHRDNLLYASSFNLPPPGLLNNMSVHDNYNVQTWVGGKVSLKIL